MLKFRIFRSVYLHSVSLCPLYSSPFVSLSQACACFHPSSSSFITLTPLFSSLPLVCMFFCPPLSVFIVLILPSVFLSLAGVCLVLPYFHSLYSHLLFLLMSRECVLPLYFFYCHTQSHLPLLSRLYIFFFLFINTDILSFWMKPYIDIWDHGLLGAWKSHQPEVSHANTVKI